MFHILSEEGFEELGELALIKVNGGACTGFSGGACTGGGSGSGSGSGGGGYTPSNSGTCTLAAQAPANNPGTCNSQGEKVPPQVKVVNGMSYLLGEEYSEDFVITSEWGWRDPIESLGQTEKTFHDGVDIAAAKGTRINNVSGGTVLEVGNDTYMGNYIVIEHPSGARTRYAHCDSINVRTGETLQSGEQIGTVGSTGKYSTGPHLHFSYDSNGNGDYSENCDNASNMIKFLSGAS